MASLNKNPKLSIVLPVLNEAKNLPLLLADLGRWPNKIEICVVDGGSSDKSVIISKISGANTLHFKEPNRGAQLHHGACNISGEWILFLHSDCRLVSNWPTYIATLIEKINSQPTVYYFNFKVNKKGLQFRLMELLVNFRSHVLKKPYGDQGLLLHKDLYAASKKNLYNKMGGFSAFHIMEDIDLIERLRSEALIKSIGIPLITDARAWNKTNVLVQGWRNALLRFQWKRGAKSSQLRKKYYLDT